MAAKLLAGLKIMRWFMRRCGAACLSGGRASDRASLGVQCSRQETAEQAGRIQQVGRHFSWVANWSKKMEVDVNQSAT